MMTRIYIGSESAARCRALVYGPCINGEIWTDGREHIELPETDTSCRFYDAEMGSALDYVWQPQMRLHRATRFHPIGGPAVIVYWAADWDRRPSIEELSSIEAIQGALPADLRSNGFWLARGLWLAGENFSRALRDVAHRHRLGDCGARRAAAEY